MDAIFNKYLGVFRTTYWAETTTFEHFRLNHRLQSTFWQFQIVLWYSEFVSILLHTSSQRVLVSHSAGSHHVWLRNVSCFWCSQSNIAGSFRWVFCFNRTFFVKLCQCIFLPESITQRLPYRCSVVLLTPVPPSKMIVNVFPQTCTTNIIHF